MYVALAARWETFKLKVNVGSVLHVRNIFFTAPAHLNLYVKSSGTPMRVKKKKMSLHPNVEDCSLKKPILAEADAADQSTASAPANIGK